MMTITFIYHSCYLIEFDGFSVIFDYYRDVPRGDGSNWVKDYLLNKEEDLYVLCSHSHSDHFNPDILNWKQRKKNITYIFSDELKQHVITDADTHCLRKEQIFEDHRLKVKTFGSTDIGCSFLLSCNDRLFFHAGDLNNWHWNEEVGKAEALTYENNYLCELELLAEDVPHLYLAMFPVDPRLGNDYMRGAEQFVSRIETTYFLPMHFREEYEKANRFGEIAVQYGCRFLPVNQSGQTFVLE